MNERVSAVKDLGISLGGEMGQWSSRVRGGRKWGGVGGTRTWDAMFAELLLCTRHQTVPLEQTKESPTPLPLVL